MENVFADDWEQVEERDGFRSHRIRLGQRLGGEMIGVTIYLLEPGQRSFPYHQHHANEELLLVLRGVVVVRTPDGEQEAGEGDTLLFRRGAEGAHQVINRSDSEARYLMFSTKVAPEVVEYPDSGNLGVFGPGLRKLVDGEAARDYFHGEG